MAVMTHRMRSRLVSYGAGVERSTKHSRAGIFRPRMVVSVGLMLVGFGMVPLMLLGWIPVTFLTAFLGFALFSSGGTMALIFCGDI